MSAVASLFQWNSSRQELNASLTIAGWQRGPTSCSSAVCPLTSPKSVLISTLTCQSTALCTASPLVCLLPGTPTLTHTLTALLYFQPLNPWISLLIFYCRLKQLLGHNFILKPQYEFVACDTAYVWLSCTHLTTAWTDPLLIDASCPLTMSSMSCFIIVVMLYKM